MMNQKFIDSETVIRSCREGILRRHSIINWKNRNFKLFGPPSGINLHWTAWECQEPTPMHVQNYSLYIICCLHISTTKCELRSFLCFLEVEAIIIKNSNLYWITLIDWNIIWQFVFIKRNVNFGICINAFHA